MLKNSAKNFVENIEKKLYLSIKEKTDSITFKLEKVLKAFSDSHLNVQHFASLTGYGHGDLGRDIIDKIFANVLDAEKAAVRLQLVSGTHAITSSLFGVLRPGDFLLKNLRSNLPLLTLVHSFRQILHNNYQQNKYN